MPEFTCIHPRYRVTVEAELDLMGFLAEWRKKHQLTTHEELSLVAGIVNRGLQDCVASERKRSART